jgi:hypothetical protein
LLNPTTAVGHDGSPKIGQTMECPKQNAGASNIQATITPSREKREVPKTVPSID